MADTTPTADGQLPVAKHSSAAIIQPNSIFTRYHHYGRELVLFLLQHGHRSLALYLRILVKANGVLKAWCYERSSKYPGYALLVYIGKVLRLLRTCWKPLQQLLCGLISLQLCITTNDDLDSSSTRASARIKSCLTLLFGMVRLRSHSCLQLSLPSPQQQPVVPEFSLVSPLPSPRMSSNTRNQQLQINSPCRSPRRSSRAQQQQQQQHGLGSLQQSSTAADHEVHVLCSGELRSAILSFLRHHTAANGHDFVLLRSTPWANEPAAADRRSCVRASALSSALGGDHTASGRMSPGACGRFRQSKQLFEALADSSGSGSGSSSDGTPRSACHTPRFSQPMRFNSISTSGDRGFAFACPQSPQALNSSRHGGYSNGLVRSSWPAEGCYSSTSATGMMHIMQQPNCVHVSGAAAPADAVVAVSIDEPQDGVATPRMRGCSAEAAADVQTQQQWRQRQQQQQQRDSRRLGHGFVAPTASGMAVFDDPCLTPLMSFSKRSLQPMHSMEAFASRASDGQQQQQQQQEAEGLSGVRPMHHYDASYTSPRSVSPIGHPACRGVRKVTRKLPPAPFSINQQQQQCQQQ